MNPEIETSEIETSEIETSETTETTETTETETETETETGSKPRGRASSAETKEAYTRILELVSLGNGVTNVKLASELGFSTLKTSAIAKRLVKTKQLSFTKDENGRVTYFPYTP
jgi:predicted HTH transcriptional regulator